MKAFVLTSPDQPAALVDLPVPDLTGDGVRVRAASVNGFDVFQANGYLVAMTGEQARVATHIAVVGLSGDIEAHRAAV